MTRPDFTIPDAELKFRASRSGGPGGQHVNTSSTRAEISWQVTATNALSPPQKARLIARIANRLDTDGWIRVVSSETRSQFTNRQLARERLEDLVRQALIPPKRRKPTRVPSGERKQRLEQKRRRGTVKQERQRPGGDD